MRVPRRYVRLAGKACLLTSLAYILLALAHRQSPSLDTDTQWDTQTTANGSPRRNVLLLLATDPGEAEAATGGGGPENESNKSHSIPSDAESRTMVGCDGEPLTTTLPPAPPAFHPRSNLTRRPVTCPSPPVPNPCCRAVYFLGSGKCGSTTMAMLLKHAVNDSSVFDPSSGFADGGKEPCWAAGAKSSDMITSRLYDRFPACRSTCDPSGEKLIVLDGCPRYGKRIQEAETIYCSDPDAKFVMLVRDPVATAISAHNDNDIIRGGSRGAKAAGGGTPLAEKANIPAKELRYGEYRAILDPFLRVFPPENILIVRTEMLSSERHLPNIMGIVQAHFGARRRGVRPVRANNNSVDRRYVLPSRQSLEATVRFYCEKSMQFYSMVGYTFDWMHHMSDLRTEQFVNKDM